MPRKSHTPALRFAGFTGEWEERKLGEVVVIERGGSPRPIEAYITNREDGHNWIKIGDAPTSGRYITKTEEKIRPEGLSKTRVVRPGDLILSNSMSFGRPYIMGISGCIHDGWLLIRNSENVFDLIFLCHLLSSKQMLEQYRSLAAGSTVNNLNKELVGKSVVHYPTNGEQCKIASVLECIDTLITAQQKKVEKLKCLKKGLMEKMFPRGGRTLPEVRFAGFSGEWVKRKLGAVCSEFRSGSFIHATSIRLHGDFPVYGGNGLRGYCDRFNHIGDYALIGRQGALCGNVNFSSGRAYFTEHAIAVKANPSNSTRFLFYLLKVMKLGQYSAQSAQPGLAVSKLTVLSGFFPVLAEQSSIGRLFRKLDVLITLHGKKLEKLRHLKQACLDKMLV